MVNADHHLTVTKLWLICSRFVCLSWFLLAESGPLISAPFFGSVTCSMLTPAGPIAASTERVDASFAEAICTLPSGPPPSVEFDLATSNGVAGASGVVNLGVPHSLSVKAALLLGTHPDLSFTDGNPFVFQPSVQGLATVDLVVRTDGPPRSGVALLAYALQLQTIVGTPVTARATLEIGAFRRTAPPFDTRPQFFIPILLGEDQPIILRAEGALGPPTRLLVESMLVDVTAHLLFFEADGVTPAPVRLVEPESEIPEAATWQMVLLTMVGMVVGHRLRGNANR